MARVLMVGLNPDEVDFTDPALPPGMTADMIRAGIARGLDDLRAAGHEATQMFIPADPAQLAAFEDRLAQQPVDCVVIGGGVRLPPRNLHLFEAVVNAVARAASRPAIALIARPDDSAAAAARVLPPR